jgi:hypothetical protein
VNVRLKKVYVRNQNAVIASEAKQSILSLRGEMDCFASLAMTVSKSLAPAVIGGDLFNS